MNFGEVLTAMVTPFNEDESVNYKQAGELAEYLVNNGSDGLVVLGTTGEVPTLTTAEKEELLEVVVDRVGERATIIAGTGSYSTAESIEMTKKAEEIGVDGAMLVTPYYNKPPQRALDNHFRLVAQETELPIILYNVPSRTGRNLDPETVAKLSQVENIVAVKEASGDVSQATKINALTDESFDIYSGEDCLTLPILSVGGTGVISVASHLVGSEIKEMVQAYKAGNVEKAKDKNASLQQIFNAMFISTNPIPVKSALQMVGRGVGPVRPPLLDLEENLKNDLKNVLSEKGLL
ncbi:4-hydroxy-tetrahydrodipicolinate synthase [Halanaerobacter jeridensis]|uniref:4-hydroxy-tetrahydrodipicolinate synthase n=1 Tax=Halanaerobacter jeridensis TaxID=706427 RepID=A0A939BT51_9FIRM|nr:4-hydroxy-tetrahydrodipicolinate synthase [Halanaerobacter jeridensis]MBM7557871.1 4-hydroxy-tetrahydrodipicolinate synthase [Halanaerobacter jeridensis]